MVVYDGPSQQTVPLPLVCVVSSGHLSFCLSLSVTLEPSQSDSDLDVVLLNYGSVCVCARARVFRSVTI